jgi:hypothetical protein
MTDNARKRDARAFQKAHPGTPYTQALREVSKGKRRPLTAVLGQGLDGSTVSANLEWAIHGGAGPHCVIVGLPGDGARTMLSHLAAGLAAGQRPEDLELIVCANESLNINCDHLRLDPPALKRHVDQLFDDRFRTLRSLDCHDIEKARDAGHRMPTTMLIVDEHDPEWWLPFWQRDREWSDSTQLARWARVGRSAGINIVLATSARVPAHKPSGPDRAELVVLRRWMEDQLNNLALINLSSTTIFTYGEGRGTLREPGYLDAVRSKVLTDFTLQSA